MSQEAQSYYVEEMNSTINIEPSTQISKEELYEIYNKFSDNDEMKIIKEYLGDFEPAKSEVEEPKIAVEEVQKENIEQDVVNNEEVEANNKEEESPKISEDQVVYEEETHEAQMPNEVSKEEVIEITEKENISEVAETMSEQGSIAGENITKEVIDQNIKAEVNSQPSVPKPSEDQESCVLPKVNKFLDVKLGSILKQEFGVGEDAIEEAISYKRALKNVDERNGSNTLSNRTLGDVLIETGIVSKKTIYQALALQKGLDFMPAYTVNARTDYKLYKSEDIYKHFGSLSDLVNVMMNTKSFISHWEADPENPNEPAKLVIVVTTPENTSSVKRLSTVLEKKGVKTHIVLSDSSVFDEFKLRYNFVTKEEMENIAAYVDQTNPVTGTTVTLREFYSYLLTYAIVEKATDIHILPVGEHLARIVFRKIGELETQFYITYSLYTRIIGFTKAHAGMKTNLNGIPQDGRLSGEQKVENGELLTNVNIRLKRKDAIIDRGLGVDENSLHYSFPKVSFRVSTYPVETSIKRSSDDPYEKLVIRVLNLSSGLTEMADLGLSSQATDELKLLKERSQGIILIVGPTGSGKSTSLYSLMNSINGLKKNIISFEDPVEMPQMLWSQGQRRVTDNEETNFDFLQATKAILRQDPDIIMMAEVRDADTARFAIDAANTGHLVLTTLHANTAASAVERLKKLGVDTLDIAISVLAIMSQRIVKKLCPHCRQKIELNETQRASLLKFELPKSFLDSNKYVFQAKKGGCYYCGGKGYQSVTVINEIIPFNKEIKKMVIDGASEIAIRDEADKQGWKTMVTDGFIKSVDGLCDINDVIRHI